ncbi:MAG: hypothetical protein ACRENX_03900 [Candidatus Dormibacteria bacterium]
MREPEQERVVPVQLVGAGYRLVCGRMNPGRSTCAELGSWLPDPPAGGGVVELADHLAWGETVGGLPLFSMAEWKKRSLALGRGPVLRARSRRRSPTEYEARKRLASKRATVLFDQIPRFLIHCPRCGTLGVVDRDALHAAFAEREASGASQRALLNSKTFGSEERHHR